MVTVIKEINTVLANAFQIKKLSMFTALTAALLAVFLLLAVPMAARAGTPAVANCTTADGQPGVRTAISVGGSNCVAIGSAGLQSNAIFVYTTNVLKVISALAGIATAGGFIWGGILYITARANAGQVEKAKMVMINSVIGLLLFIFMYAILQFLVPGGVFT
jgi:hypothetical protein